MNDLNYHMRVDYRALDVMVQAIDRASKPELEAAYKTARQEGKDFGLPDTRRLIWADLARVLKRATR